MIHDTDLLDKLVTLIKAAPWIDSSKVADVRRVWGGDVHLQSIPAGQILVQLWPQSQKHSRAGRAGPYSPTISLSVGFYFRVASQTMPEVDAALQSFDRLLVSEEDGLGRDLLDIVTVTTDSESMQFIRDPSVTWTLRPDRDLLQRIQPDGDVERYSGVCQSQAELVYSAFV